MHRLTPLLLVLVACAHARSGPVPAGGPPPAAAQPAGPTEAQRKAVAAAFERELAPLRAQAFQTSTGIRGEVEAKARPALQPADGKVQSVLVDLGTSQPMSCALTTERLDVGGAVVRMLDAIRKEVEVVQVQPVEVSVAKNGDVVVFFEALYRKPSPQGPLVGMVKLAVAPHPTHSALCSHDEPGYAKSFRRVVKALAASMRSDAEDERAGARWAATSVLYVGQMPVGYEEEAVYGTEAGGRKAVSIGSMFAPRAPAEFVAHDSYTGEVSDARGILAQKVRVEAQNGELETQLALARGEDGTTYRYEGTKSGKKVAGQFTTGAGLATEFWFAKRLAKGFGKEPALRHEGWTSSDPTRAVPVVYEKGPGSPRAALVTLGDLKLTGELDANGLVSEVSEPVGATTLRVKRVFVRGAP